MRKKLWALIAALSAVALCVTSGASASGGTGYVLQGSFTGASNAVFGNSLATDGSTVVVGAYNDNATKGAAYVYLLTGSTWALQQVLTAPDGAANDQFGYAVAISGNTATIGAGNKANGQGYVYVFTRTGITWSLEAEFTSSDGQPGDCFGCAIALRGGTALIGANYRLGGTGGAYIFTGSGSTWQQGQEFVGASGSTEQFGYSVALSTSGTTAVVGAFEFSNATGHAYVFTSNGSTWSQQALLAASGGGTSGANFGYSVAVDGNTAIVGAYGQGAAYVFTSSAGVWSQQAVLTASGSAYFGYSVALSGATALVGAFETTGTTTVPPTTVLPTIGAAYVFTNTSGTWSQQQELPAQLPPQSGQSQSFGWSVALSPSAAVVGALSVSNFSGAAYVFAQTVAPVAAPALGSAGRLTLSLLLLAAAFWSMNRRVRYGMYARDRVAGIGTMALSLLLGTAACSGNLPATGQGSSTAAPGAEDTGTVSLKLTLPGGEQVNVIHWIISGPNGAATVVQSSSVTVQALAVNFLVSGIPAAPGYSVTLSGTSADSAVTCSGAAQFGVTAHATTLVAVQMACGLASTTGRGTSVNGTTYDCASLSFVSANPIGVTVGGSVALASLASGPLPGMLTYAWSSSTGSFSEPNEPTTSFTCTQIGSAMVTVTVGDGPVPAGSTCGSALDTTTITVVCEPPPCTGVGTGTPATPDNSSGTCPAGQSNTLTDPFGNFCCAQKACFNGATQVGTGTLATPDNSAGACPAGQVNALTDSVGNFCCVVPFCSGQPVGVACDAGLICSGGLGCVVPSFSVVRVNEFDAGGDADPSSAVVIEQHLLDGSVTGTPVSLPTAASGTVEPFTVGGTAVTEGDLNTSTNGLYLTMAGYQAAPGVVSVDTSPSTAVTRAVARIDANGNVVTTPVAGAFSGGDPRSAVTVDGFEYWVSGTNATTDSTNSGGLWYLPSDSEIVQMPAPTLLANPRLLRIAGGQLYGDSSQDPPYLFSVGTGLPTAASVLTTLPGFPASGATPSPYSFVFFDLSPSIPGVDTLYIADDTSGTGGLEKWALSSGGSWSTIWSILTGGTAIRGLAGYVTGSTVTLMASSASTLGKQDGLAVILDPVGSSNSSMTPVTVVATSGSGSTFRGVAIPPHL
jgi:hypothetical protein